MLRRIWALIANADFAGSTACTRSTSFPNSEGKNLCQFKNHKLENLENHLTQSQIIHDWRGERTLMLPASLMAAMILTWSASCRWPTVDMTTSTCFMAFTKVSWSYRSPCHCHIKRWLINQTHMHTSEGKRRMKGDILHGPD